MREELKIDACPFCGGEGEDDCVNAVHCACGAAMQVPYTGQKTSRKAITAWNARAKPPQGADDNHKALVEGIKAIAERWIYRTAHHGPEHLCSGIAQEIAAMAAAQSRQEEK